MALNTSETGPEKQLKKILETVFGTLLLLQKQDLRMGARPLYRDPQFVAAVTQYFIAVNKTFDTKLIDKTRVSELKKGASAFLDYVNDRYAKDISRILTTLRRQIGKSFTELYKDTRVLIRLCDVVVAVDSSLEPLKLPDQKPSPIYTKIEKDRVVLDSGRALHPFLRKEGINETRRYLKTELIKVLEALDTSNVDRRYVEAFKALTVLINFKNDAGAISFGLHVRMVSQLTQKVEAELSDILNTQIAATLTHASYFASQYKDWMDFIHYAQNYPSSEAVENQIDQALANVTMTLKNSPATVDERIPKTIGLIIATLNGTKEDRIQAIYAGVRSVENLCIATIKYSYDQALRLLQDAGSSARPKLVKIGAAAILMVAVGVIADFMPVIVSASDLNWILENMHNLEKIGRILK